MRGTWDERIDRHASTDHVLGQPTRQPQERRLGSPVVNHLAQDEPSGHTCADQNPAQAFLTTRARMNSLTEISTELKTQTREARIVALAAPTQSDPKFGRPNLAFPCHEF